jgi:hypothetical protein
VKYTFSASFGDTGIRETLALLATLPAFRDPPPATSPLVDRPLVIDDIASSDLAAWPTLVASAKNEAHVMWPFSVNMAKSIVVNPRAQPPRVRIQVPAAIATLEEGLQWIESLPFEVCSVGPLHGREWAKLDVEPFGFGVGHTNHGWACAFRGNGHDRLVSRRWLDYGPWRVLRRPNDLTIVQFHDLDVDPETAAQQALPGWQRMGLSRTGGFLPVPYRFRSDVEGLYVAATRTLEIVVPPDGTIEQVQMRDACAVRSRHRVVPPAPDKPIDQVAFVFLDEADARRHLHELWLRELEVWVADGGGKRRVDLDYHPTPIQPDWVAGLEARGA